MQKSEAQLVYEIHETINTDHYTNKLLDNEKFINTWNDLRKTYKPYGEYTCDEIDALVAEYLLLENKEKA